MERVTCFPNEGTPQVIPGAPQEGDIIRTPDGDYFRYYAPVEPTPVPVVLDDLEFLRHAASQLSPSRVVEIEEAFRDSANKELRYAWKEYDKAKSFTKDKVTEFLSAGSEAGILTAQERNLVLDNWPEV